MDESAETRLRIAKECGLLDEDVRTTNVQDLFQRIGEFGIRIEAAAMEKAAALLMDMRIDQSIHNHFHFAANAIRAAAKKEA